MRVSMELKLTWKVVVLLFLLFDFIGLFMHFVYLVYLDGVLWVYYGFVGIVFVMALNFFQRVYIMLYARQARANAKREIKKHGKKPSEVISQLPVFPFSGKQPKQLKKEMDELEKEVKKMQKKIK